MKLAIKTVGTLVLINGTLPVIAAPTANPVEKNGKKQFWFYKNRAILAIQTTTGYTAKY